MVIPNRTDALLLERWLTDNNFRYWWFTQDKGNAWSGWSMGLHLDGNFYANRDTLYEILTKGIDKRYNSVIEFTDQYILKFKLIIHAEKKHQITQLTWKLRDMEITNAP